MTSREEIERLLNQTGRTLEGLPEDYGDKKLELWNSFRDKTFGHIKSFDMANRILHQSDVIELLISALRDALDKPMQKPLTPEEVVIYADPVWLEFRLPGGHGWYLGIGLATRAAERWYRHYQFSTCVYGKDYRFWRQRPTDEEREAAAWES